MIATMHDTISPNKREEPVTMSHRDRDDVQAERRAPRILLAEDDLEMRRFLAFALRMDGYEVFEFASGVEVLDRIGPYLYNGMEFDVDLIISDIRMPGADGLEILSGLGMCDGAPPVILITAFGDHQTHIDAERLGAIELIDKPFDVNELRAVLRRVLPPRSK